MASGSKERGWESVQHSAVVPYCPSPELLPASDRAAAEEGTVLHTTPTPFAVLKVEFQWHCFDNRTRSLFGGCETTDE